MKRMGMAVVLTMAVLGVLSARSAHAALVVNGPGEVLMVDGGDKNSTVGLFGLSLTGLPAGYDFGFMDGGTFIPIALSSRRGGAFHSFYTFSGGTVVDFAVRNNATGAIFTMADAAGDVTQLYTRPINPSKSSDPVVSSDYYRVLTLDWKLNGNGLDPLDSQGLIVTLRSLKPQDGMMPEAAPVKLLGSLIFATGLAGLVAWRRLAS